MFRLVVGLVIGYVLGAKAGRERYEQIMRLSSKAADSPAVQGAAGFLRAKLTALITKIMRRPQPEKLDTAYLFDDIDVPPATITSQAGPPRV